MIDHLSIKVADFAKARKFYEAALQPLDYKVLRDFSPRAVGLGSEKPDFWVIAGPKATPNHIAFAAKDRLTVDKFYESAIAAGAKDNGKPGMRKQYHEHYYGAFVIDPDGNNVEAVCHKPE
jgi:catechol 2,3-dioxygenase-like lactoylglutathione lyase family enzyme